MIITLKGPLRDVIKFIRHLKIRIRKFRKASSQIHSHPQINQLSESLHPFSQKMVISKIIRRGAGVKSFRLKKADGSIPAIYQAGQYIVVESEIRGTLISRPYSLSSTPEETIQFGYYEITIKEAPDGFFSVYSNQSWKEGMPLLVSEPMGYFYYSPIRDESSLVFFAGGSGITPVRSIIKTLLEKSEPLKILLFYGFNTMDDYIFKEDFKDLAFNYKDKFTFVPVVNKKSSGWEGEVGLISKELIIKYYDQYIASSWFICGPQAMKEALFNVAEKFKQSRYTIRQESFIPDKSSGVIKDKEVQITVYMNFNITILKGSTEKTIISTLEQAGLNPPVYCRSGECGWCRSKLVSGEVYVPDSVSGIRMADLKFGYIHPCCSYPKTDIEIEILTNPLGNDKR